MPICNLIEFNSNSPDIISGAILDTLQGGYLGSTDSQAYLSLIDTQYFSPAETNSYRLNVPAANLSLALSGTASIRTVVSDSGANLTISLRAKASASILSLDDEISISLVLFLEAEATALLSIDSAELLKPIFSVPVVRGTLFVNNAAGLSLSPHILNNSSLFLTSATSSPFLQVGLLVNPEYPIISDVSAATLSLTPLILPATSVQAALNMPYRAKLTSGTTINPEAPGEEILLGKHRAVSSLDVLRVGIGGLDIFKNLESTVDSELVLDSNVSLVSIEEITEADVSPIELTLASSLSVLDIPLRVARPQGGTDFILNLPAVADQDFRVNRELNLGPVNSIDSILSAPAVDLFLDPLSLIPDPVEYPANLLLDAANLQIGLLTQPYFLDLSVAASTLGLIFNLEPNLCSVVSDTTSANLVISGPMQVLDEYPAELVTTSLQFVFISNLIPESVDSVQMMSSVPAVLDEDFRLSSVLNLDTADVASEWTIQQVGLAGLGGFTEAPTQIQEYVKYPVPTGGGQALPLDSEGDFVYPSQSVFGAMAIRVGSGLPGTGSLSGRVRASYLSQPGEYSNIPEFTGTMVFLRSSLLDTSSTQRAVLGSDAIGPNVTRLATYSDLPRNYSSSVASMGSGGSATLASENAFTFGNYQNPNRPVLMIGSALVRHNNKSGAVVTPSKPISVAADFYYPSTAGRKLAPARVESTVGSYTEGLSPMYTASTMRLLSPSEFQEYSAASGAFQVNAAVLPQDGVTAGTSVSLHASDSMFGFYPIKQGVRYFYSKNRSSISAFGLSVESAYFLGGSPGVPPLEFTVLLEDGDLVPVPPGTAFSQGADCALRITISPYEASSLFSTVVVDVPVIGISQNDSTRIVVDSSYRWFLQACSPGGILETTHSIRCMKEHYNIANGVQQVSSNTVLAASRPVVLIDGDQGESLQALLSVSGDRNLLIGSFSLAVSRPDLVLESGVRVNTPGADLQILDADTEGTAIWTSSFDVNKLHLFIKSDGTLAGKRIIQTDAGIVYDTNLAPILPYEVQSFIAGGGKFTKVKVGESVIALLSEPQDQENDTGRRLYIWGFNTFGHLTVPTAVDADFATQGYIDEVKDFDFNVAHIAVVLENGQLHSWGCNSSGAQWFDRDNGTPPVSEFAIGENFSVAYVRKNSGNTIIGKLEQYGDAPNPATIPSVTLKARTEVYTNATNGLQVFAGEVLVCGKNHAAALKSDGTVVCWGDDTYGQSTVPVDLSGVVGIAAGDNHTVALKSDGTVVCWGDNLYGQCTVPANLNAKKISAGGNFTAAIRSATSTDVSPNNGSVSDDEVENTLACWGDNAEGQCTVPVCEGLSYDPSAHKYRMRFWDVSCGWDHVVAVRMDDHVAKAARDHSELTRYVSTKTKFTFKDSSGNTIFEDLNFPENAGWSDSAPVISANSGYGYSLTPVSGDTTWESITFTVAGVDYRLRFERTPGSETQHSTTGFKIQYNSGSGWDNLTLGYKVLADSNGDWPPTYNSLNWTFDIWGLRRNWSEDSSNWGAPFWAVSLPDYGMVELFEFTTGANGEYFSCNFDVADTELVGLDKKHVVWGNPLGYDVSCTATSYQAYYPSFNWSSGTDLELDLRGALTDDAVSVSPFLVDSEDFQWAGSYMGYGRQLGACPNWTDSNDFFLRNYFLGANILTGTMYLGPTSLKIGPFEGVQVSSGDPFNPTAHGTPHICYTTGGTTKLFNLPTPVGPTELRVFASPELRSANGSEGNSTIYDVSRENFVSGFNNNAPYTEIFQGALPSGFSIVANGSVSLPANTKDSLTGYHLIWSGFISSLGSVTLVMTGARWEIDRLALPFDPTYQFTLVSGFDFSFLGLQLRNAQVIKHQTSHSAVSLIGESYSGKGMKHMTRIPRYQGSSSSVLRNLGFGLTISGNSLQGGPSVQYAALRDVIVDDPGQFWTSLYGKKAYFNYRSFIGFQPTPFYINQTSPSAKKISLIPVLGGDNTKGQLNISLMGPFSYNSELRARGIAGAPLSTSWFMDLGQTNIGHTQNPSLEYGFKSVSCGQFHTLAIDEDDSVHAAGSNYAIRPAAVTRRDWNPYDYSWDGCDVRDDRDPPHLVTGYFRNFVDSRDSAVIPAFTDDRSNSSFPAGATNRDLVEVGNSYFFEYPNAAKPSVDVGCIGNYDTNAVLVFDDSGLWSTGETVVIQQVAASGPVVKVGLELSNGVYRLFACDNLNRNRSYTQPLLSAPRLVFVSIMEEFDPNGNAFLGHSVAVKTDGEYVLWENETYLSAPVPSLRFRRFLDRVGDLAVGSLVNGVALRREFMPLSPALTQLVAGDSYFFGFYKDGTTDSEKIVGSLSLPSGPQLGVSNIISQGPLLKGADQIVGAKGYFATRVDRTYKTVSGSVTSGTPYAGVNSGDLRTIRYDPDANNGQGNFKVYVGPQYDNPAADGLVAGDRTIGFNYNYTADDPIWGSDNTDMTWPKIIFIDDLGPDNTTPLWNQTDTIFQPLAYAPYDLTVYQSGYGISTDGQNTPFEHEDENEFRIATPYNISDVTPLYPAKPLTPNPFGENVDLGSNDFVLVYDNVTRRLLPQVYRPNSAVGGGLLSISVGPEHTVVVNSDNTVTTWGSNSYDQRSLMEGVSGVVKAVTQGDVTLVLTITGAIQGYAFNTSFNTLIGDIPQGVFTDVVIGANHALALRNDGTVIAWGQDVFGSTQVPVDLGPCTKIACGAYHSVALTAAGKVRVWGNTFGGQGDIPTTIQNGTSTAIACTYNGVAARDSATGVVYFWGPNYEDNSVYACNDLIGSNTSRFYVVRTSTGAIQSPGTQPQDVYGEVANIPAGTGWTRLAQGIQGYHMAACTASTTYAWGLNYTVSGSGTEGGWRGQAFVPNGTTDRLGAEFHPTTVTNNGPYRHVAISAPAGVDQYIDLIPASIRARNEDAVYTQEDIAGMKHVVSLAAGNQCFVAVQGDTYASTQGSLLAWGLDPSSSGILTVPTGTDFTQVSCRNLHAAALDADGDVHAWGRSNEGATTVPAALADGSSSSCRAVACGDTFTAVILQDRTISSWGSLADIPRPFDTVKFSEISCGVSHIAGRVFEQYVELVDGGNFILSAGSAVAFSANDPGLSAKCALPGFSYTVDNNVINCPVVAGGEFTAFLMPSSGFNVVNTSGTGSKSVVFGSFASHEDPLTDPEDELNSELLEGYLIHTSGSLCLGILPESHNFYFNPPTRSRTPDGETSFFDINYTNAFTNITGRISGATDVPASYARGGGAGASIVSPGRFKQWKYETPDHVFGCGYSVIVDKTSNVPVVAGGHYLPSTCPVDSYPQPPHSIGIRDVPVAEFSGEEVTQVETYRGTAYALTARGRVIRWGYNDSTAIDYATDSTVRSFISVPDMAVNDSLSGAKWQDSTLLGMTYIAGLPGFSNTWSVKVELDRYIDGQKTTLRRFALTGDVEQYPVADPVHFSETFLELDTWPATANNLDSQYVLSVKPRGVVCDINGASLFGMNLDSRGTGGAPVLLEASGVSSNSQVADYFIADASQLALPSSTLLDYGDIRVTTASEQIYGINLTTISEPEYPSYLVNSYGSSARMETVNGSSIITGGRIANIATATFADLIMFGIIPIPSVWLRNEDLPSVGTEVSSWATSSEDSDTWTFTQTNTARYPSVVAFNSSYKGIQLDSTNGEEDYLQALGGTTVDTFTQFLVYNKSTSSNGEHAAFVWHPSGNPRAPLGIGFDQGIPLLLRGIEYFKAVSATATGTHMLCSYYGGGPDSYKGLRQNGTQLTLGSSQVSGVTGAANINGVGYYLGRNVFRGTANQLNYHDNNDVYAEIIAFNTALTPSQIEIVEGYLAHKLNLTSSLPNDHPYKNEFPGLDVLNQVRLSGINAIDFMSAETPHAIPASGVSQSWIGMFDVGMNHRSTRAGFDHHSPLIAEFEIVVDNSFNLLAMVVEGQSAVPAANLTINTIANGVYLAGAASFESVVEPADIAVGKLLTPRTVTPSLTVEPAFVNLIMALYGEATSSLGIFGPEYCIPGYGCFGISDEPPTLEIIVPGISIQPMVLQLDVPAVDMSKNVNITYARINTNSNVEAAALSIIYSLESTSAAALTVNKALIKSLKLDLLAQPVSAYLAVVVCEGDFAILGEPIKKYATSSTKIPFNELVIAPPIEDGISGGLPPSPTPPVAP